MIFTHGQGKVRLEQLFSMLFFFFWEICIYRDIVTVPAKSNVAIVTCAKMADCTHSRKWLEVTWRGFISPFSAFNFLQTCWCLSQDAVIILTPSGCKFNLQLLLTLVLDVDLMRVCFVQVRISTVTACMHAQGIYNRPGIKCKNGCLEIASQIIDRFYFVDQIFAQFFLLDESCIYSAHVGT